MVLKIATTGLVSSFLMNLATFGHYNPLNQYSAAVLFAGLFLVWTATIPAWRRLGFGPRQLLMAPDEVRYAAFALAGYLFFTILSVLLVVTKEGAMVTNTNGHLTIPIPAEYSARVFTAALMLFYGTVVATQRLDRSERGRARNDSQL